MTNLIISESLSNYTKRLYVCSSKVIAHSVSLTYSRKFRNNLITYFTGGERIMDFGKSCKVSMLAVFFFSISIIFFFKIDIGNMK